MTSNIVVLASNSFAGSAYVAYALSKGRSVWGISRSPEPDDVLLSHKHVDGSKFQFHQLDLNHNFQDICSLLSEIQPEVIVDFAGQGMVAESWNIPEQWYETNIVSKVKLHNFLKSQKWLKRYIRISTPEVYGSCDNLIKEGQHYNPSTPYAVSHAAIDMSLKVFFQNYDFPVIFGRFANFYGEYQQLYRIIPKVILCIRSGTRLQLHGGGKSVRAFIHSTEVADAIDRMIKLGSPGEVYHFSTDKFYSIREVVQIICKKLNVDIDRVTETTPERPGKDMAYLMSSEKANAKLEWYSHISLSEGIDRTIAWINHNYERLSQYSWSYIHKA